MVERLSDEETDQYGRRTFKTSLNKEVTPSVESKSLPRDKNQKDGKAHHKHHKKAFVERKNLEPVNRDLRPED